MMHRALLLATLAALAVPVPAAPAVLGAPLAATNPCPLAGPDPLQVDLTTEDELVLKGTYLEPKSKKQLAPAAILVHDAGGSRSDLDALAERCWKQGFAVLTLDLRGHGASATDELSWAKLDEDGRGRAWALATRDIEAAADWLRERKEVHKTSLSLIGMRAGSSIAVRHAMRDENVRAIALVCPKAEEYGTDVAGTIQKLGGLPTYIVSMRDGRPEAEAMIEEAHESSGGHPYIDLLICTSKAAEKPVAADKKTLSSVAKWLKDKAMPKKAD